MKDEYKLMVSRLEPTSTKINGKEVKINGFLASYYTPTNLVELMEDVHRTYGGGKYNVKIVDPAGKYLKTKIFEISGEAKLPARPCSCSIETLMLRGCQLPGVHV